MTGPPAALAASTVSAQIREQEQPTLKFRSEYVDVLECSRRVEVITQAEARRRLKIGGYEAVGNNTVKYLRLISRPTKKTIYSWSGGKKSDGRHTEADSKPGVFRS